jgi:hypothetical protein
MMCNVSKTIVLETYSFDTERYDRPLYTHNSQSALTLVSVICMSNRQKNFVINWLLLKWKLLAIVIIGSE